MQTISITEIHPSPNPIRKTWDEGKMEELAQSIKERGVIVPIKVRPTWEPCPIHGYRYWIAWDSSFEHGDMSCCSNQLATTITENGKKYDDFLEPSYEVVYGHRRVEAAMLANLWEMPAIVEGVDDTGALIQALIENVQREDMNPVEVGECLVELTRLGLSQSAVAKSVGMTQQRISHLVQLAEETEAVKSLVGTHIGGGKTHNKSYNGVVEGEPITETHVRSAREAGIKDPFERETILIKASKEGMTYRETREVSEAYKQAETPELKQKVLETSGKLGDADRILQVAKMKLAGRHVSEGREEQRAKAFQEFDTAVKDFLDSIRMFDHMIGAAEKATKYGKFSPEAKPFTIRKIDHLIAKLESLKEALGDD